MHPDPFALFTSAIDELLTGGKITGSGIDDVVELIVQRILDKEGDRAEAYLRDLDEWLAHFETHLKRAYTRAGQQEHCAGLGRHPEPIASMGESADPLGVRRE
jgi:hypothetical protein